MKIVIFGKDGQLGNAFKEAVASSFLLSGDNHIQFIGRAECDLRNAVDIQNVLDRLEPDLIINAAAYTAVDRAEEDQNLAFAVNERAPRVMAHYAAIHGSTLLHYSTDYVFDGAGLDPYSEDHPINPLGVYGKSKAAGEQAIVDAFFEVDNSQARYAIFRTSWVYGKGSNFIRTILRLAKEREELKVIHDQHGVPTDASWLAKTSLALSIDKQGSLQNFPSGIYHAVPAGETTWHGLACFALQVSLDEGVTMKTLPGSIKPIPFTEYPLPAPRPMNSRMSTQKLQKTLKDLGAVSKFPMWDELVRTYVTDLAKNQLI